MQFTSSYFRKQHWLSVVFFHLSRLFVIFILVAWGRDAGGSWGMHQYVFNYNKCFHINRLLS